MEPNIRIAKEFWIVGEVVPVADKDDAYCGQGDCPKRGLKHHTVIRIKNVETGQVRDVRRVGCCCAKKCYGGDGKGDKPVVERGMKTRYVKYWVVLDKENKSVKTFRWPAKVFAEEFAATIGAKVCDRQGWEIFPDPTTDVRSPI
jgi:hypothetical protein